MQWTVQRLTRMSGTAVPAESPYEEESTTNAMETAETHEYQRHGCTSGISLRGRIYYKCNGNCRDSRVSAARLNQRNLPTRKNLLQMQWKLQRLTSISGTAKPAESPYEDGPDLTPFLNEFSNNSCEYWHSHNWDSFIRTCGHDFARNFLVFFLSKSYNNTSAMKINATSNIFLIDDVMKAVPAEDPYEDYDDDE